MTYWRKLLLTLWVLLYGAIPIWFTASLALSAMPRENCTLDDQAVGSICSEWGELYWLLCALFALSLISAVFLIHKKPG